MVNSGGLSTIHTYQRLERCSPKGWVGLRAGSGGAVGLFARADKRLIPYKIGLKNVTLDGALSRHLINLSLTLFPKKRYGINHKGKIMHTKIEGLIL